MVHHTKQIRTYFFSKVRSDLFFYMVYLIFKVRFMGLELWYHIVIEVIEVIEGNKKPIEIKINE